MPNTNAYLEHDLRLAGGFSYAGISFSLRVGYESDHLSIRHLSNDSNAHFRARLYLALLSFFADTSAVRDVMRKTNALISGSTVLWVLCGGAWVPGDLDIIIDEDGFGVVHDLLTSNEFGALCTSSTYYNDVAAFRGDWTVVSFIRLVEGRAERGKVDVMICSGRRGYTPFMHIALYHSTCVMNFLSAHRLVLLFPHFTFAGINVINDRSLNKCRCNACIVKYQGRGYMPARCCGRPVVILDLNGGLNIARMGAWPKRYTFDW